MHDKTSRIGCGFANCPGNGGNRGGRTYVCNYAYGQSSEVKARPFEKGTPCAASPNKCSNNLCGKFIQKQSMKLKLTMEASLHVFTEFSEFSD